MDRSASYGAGLADVPPIEVVLLDRPDLPSGRRRRDPDRDLAPAIANAIRATTGHRPHALPLAPGQHDAVSGERSVT